MTVKKELNILNAYIIIENRVNYNPHGLIFRIFKSRL